MPPLSRWLSAAVLSVLLAGSAQAQPPAATAESRREAAALITQINLVEQQREMIGALRGQFVRLLSQSSGKTEAEVMAVVDEVLLPDLRARMPELTNAITEVYANLFSAEDLRGLQAFYGSPIGQTLLRHQAQLGRLTFELGSLWGQKVSREAIARHGEALRKRGFKL